MADGQIITMPLAFATFFNMAIVTPGQSPPTMAFTLSEVMSRSVTATAALSPSGRGSGEG